MTPQARAAAAVMLLEEISASSQPADRVAAKFVRERRYIGAKDRRAVLDQVYGVIRRQAALDWWIVKAGPIPPAPRSRVLAALALEAGSSAKEIAEIFSGGRYAPPPLSDAERALVAALEGRTLHPDGQPISVKANCPEWLAPLLQRRFRGHFLEEMEALNTEAPLDLRVNTLLTSREDVLGRLLASRIEAAPTKLSPWGLRLAARGPITGLELYRDGLIEIQDEGSQLVAILTAARPGQTVVDMCAGAGGKSLALAVSMRNHGEIAALDVSRRLTEAAPRIKRAGAKIVKLHRLAPDDPWLAKRAGRADRVLVDAPCAGTGRWRRDPMERFRLTPEELARLVALQRQILKQAAALVKPGGRLVYATCSLLREEGEDQADWFVKAEPEFRTVPVGEVWAETLGGDCPTDGPYLVLTPKRHETDGFFVAVFECMGVAQ